MDGEDQRTATLLAFQAHLEVLKAELSGLLCSALMAQRTQRDDWARRTQLFSSFQSAHDSAIELLNGELRSVIPESAVESTPQAWCVRTIKTLEKVERWIRELAFAQPPGGLPLPLPSLMSPVQKANLHRWQVAPRNRCDGVPIINVSPDAEQRTKVLQDELLDLDADVFRFLQAMEGQAVVGTIDKTTKPHEQTLPLTPNAKTRTDETTEFSFEVDNEVVRIRGFGEEVTLERTEGVQRLIAVVTSPSQRMSVMKLAQIGEAPKTTKRDSIDLDGDGLTERESVNAEQFESALGADALQGARDAIVDMIAERDAALSDGDEVKAERLTAQINVSLKRPRTGWQDAAGVVRKTLDRTYDRLQKDGKGKRLAAHFAKHIERPRQSPDYIYKPDESGRKICWNLK